MSDPIDNVSGIRAKSQDGGPAFPGNGDDMIDGEPGMTLRDYFAAKALIAYAALDSHFKGIIYLTPLVFRVHN